MVTAFLMFYNVLQSCLVGKVSANYAVHLAGGREALDSSKGYTRPPRVTAAAIWGILASAVFPLLTGRQDQVFVLCPIGAAVAIAAVAIARRAELRGSAQPMRVLDVILDYVGSFVRDAVIPTKEPAA